MCKFSTLYTIYSILHKARPTKVFPRSAHAHNTYLLLVSAIQSMDRHWLLQLECTLPQIIGHILYKTMRLVRADHKNIHKITVF